MNIFYRSAVSKPVLFLVSIFLFSAINISAQIKSIIVSANGSVGTVKNVYPERTLENSGSVNTKLPAVFDMEKTVFAILNAKRKEQNLPLLEWSDEVAKIARVHSENMARFKFFSHRGQDGTMVDDRADSLGVSRWQAIGENIAFNKGYENPAEFAVERWMISLSHRQNILDNRWRESAVGAAIADDGAVYFTQVFLLRK